MTRIAAVGKLIASQLQELELSPDWRDSIAVGPTSDLLDTSQQATTREMVCRDLNRNAQLASHLRAALDRIAGGTYGICANCNQPVGAKRLAAVPWAPLCLACQEQAEVVAAGYDRAA